jgi:NAD(P)H-dependent FMN reductase
VAQPVLQIIIGSTRPGRVGPAVAAWIIDRARARGDFDVVVTRIP